jgi:glycogen operon protein
MILMGDEVRRTQRGNNNAYCHDNELNWFDWSLVQRHADLRRFVSLLCERRRLRTVEHERKRVNLGVLLRNTQDAWHGVNLNLPDWSDSSLSVALGGEFQAERLRFYLMLNAYWRPLEFELPKLTGGAQWRRWVDTSLDSPNDIVPWKTAPTISENHYRVESRSVVLLFIS